MSGIFTDELAHCRQKRITRNSYRFALPTRGIYPEQAEQIIHEAMMSMINQLPTEKLMELFEIERYTSHYWDDKETVEIRFHRDVYTPSGMVECLNKEVNELEAKRRYLNADIQHIDWMIEQRLKELTNK